MPPLRRAEEWAAIHRFRRRRHEESRSEEPFEPDGLAKLDMQREEPSNISEMLVARDGDEVAGFATIWIPRPGAAGYESNRGILWFDLYVLRESRGRGVGRAIFPQVLEVAQRHEGRLIGTNAEEPEGVATLEGHGFKRRSEARYSRLDLLALDWSRVAAWAAEGRQRSPERTLRLLVGSPPADELEAHSRSMTELFNTIPWDDIDHGDIVFTPETVIEGGEHHERLGGVMTRHLVYEPDGRMTAGTEMLHFPDAQPEHAHQWLTAVHRTAQGNGIGRWMKCEMRLHLRRTFPRVRWVLTDNASSNSHKLKINIELGFRPYRVEGTYQAALADLSRG